jgi:hypothetical protein
MKLKRLWPVKERKKQVIGGSGSKKQFPEGSESIRAEKLSEIEC